VLPLLLRNDYPLLFLKRQLGWKLFPTSRLIGGKNVRKVTEALLVAKKLTVFEYEKQLKREYAEKMADWTLSKEEKGKAYENYAKAVRELYCRYGNRIGDACAQSDGWQSYDA